MMCIQARLGERETAQVHLNGTRELLRLCDQRKAYLSHAVKRAIFWYVRLSLKNRKKLANVRKAGLVLLYRYWHSSSAES